METKKMTYMQAVRLALDEEFARDEKVIMMGWVWARRVISRSP